MNAPLQHRVFANSAIRRATLDDMPRMLEIAEEMYPGRGVKAGWDWMKWNIENRTGDKFVWVGDDSLIVAHIYKRYGYELCARVDMLCARRAKKAVFEALQLVKAAVRWAALNGVERPLKLDADTGADFGAFARRLGGWKVDPEQYPVYEIPLVGGSL